MKTYAVAVIRADGIEFLRDPDASRLVGSAVHGVLAAADALTPDLGGGGTTSSVTQAVIPHMAGARG